MIGYRIYGFCDCCLATMPKDIPHDDLSAYNTLQRNLRHIVAESHGWFHHKGKDYCPLCVAKRSFENKREPTQA